MHVLWLCPNSPHFIILLFLLISDGSFFNLFMNFPYPLLFLITWNSSSNKRRELLIRSHFSHPLSIQWFEKSRAFLVQCCTMKTHTSMVYPSCNKWLKFHVGEGSHLLPITYNCKSC